MTQATATTGIGVVRAEVDRLLGQVRAEIEAVADDQGAKGGLQQTPARLHEIRGVLLALQLPVAARLADEMERVAEALRDRRVPDARSAAETLMLASIQLPDHLERLEGGRPDLPEDLLDPINELRRVRGDVPLLEEDLLVPLGAGTAEETLSPELVFALQRAAKEIRPVYHRALLNWFRGDSPKDSLRALESVFATLSRASGDSNVAAMFRVVQAVVRGYEAKAVATSSGAKSLVGRVDRLIRLLSKGEDPRLTAGATDRLFAEFLSELSKNASPDPLVSEIKQRFALPAVPLDKEALEALRAQLGSLDSATRQVLTQNVAEELVSVKDALDLFVRAASSDAGALSAVVEPLRGVARTLTAAGFWGLAQRLEVSTDIIEEMVSGDLPADGSRLMAVAETIASVEAVLAYSGGTDKAGAAEQGHRVPQGLLKQFVNQALRESAVDLRKAKDLFEAYSSSADPSRVLGEIVPLLDRTAGALKLVERDAAAQLVESVSSYLKGAMLRSKTALPADTVDTVADAVASVEYFTESESGNAPAVEGVLARATAAIRRLGTGESGLSLVAEPKPGLDQTEGPETAGGYEAELAVTGGDEAGTLGAEFLDVFAEEAREEQPAIESAFDRWRSHPADTEALARLRRAFHTLKGSGRLVGATQIGDLAWTVEDLLNRVIEGAVTPGSAVMSYVEEIVQVLPGLVEASVTGAEADADVDGLVARGQSLTEPSVEPAQAGGRAGLSLDAAAIRGPDAAIIKLPVRGRSQRQGGEAQIAGAAPSDVAQPPTGRVPSQEAATPELDIDTELLAIFRDEADQQLARLHAFTDAVNDEAAGGAIDESLVRACHTLKGSARIAGFDDVARLAKGLEDAFVTLSRRQALPPPALLVQVKRSVELMEEALTRPSATDPAFEDELDRLLEGLGALGKVTGETPAAPPTAASPAAEVAESLEPVIEPAREPIAETRGVAAQAGEARVGEEAEVISTAAWGAAETGDYQVVETDPDLLDAFVQDARDLLDALDDSLRKWQRQPADLAVVAGVQRLIHTLKGSARLAGVRAIGDLCHAFESLLTAVANRQASATETVLQLAQQVGDRLFEQIQAVERGKPVRKEPETVQAIALALETALGDLDQAIPEIRAQQASTAPSEIPVAVTEEPPDSQPAALPLPSGPEKITASQAPAADDDSTRHEFIRVRSDLLNLLVNNAGEVNIYRSRLEQQNHTLRFNLTELDQTIARLRTQLRQLEIETEAQILFRYDRDRKESDEPEAAAFDPLELDRFSLMQQLSRSLMETVNDLNSISGLLTDTQSESDALLVQQGRIAADLQHGLLNTRMVPFAQIVPRLRRVVRQTAEVTGRRAELEVTGAQGELDRTILDQILAPLEHMLRNAVAHGIEKPDQRIAAGKPEMGRVSLGLRREGNDVLIAVADDGAGLNLDAIRSAAAAKGLLDGHAEVADQDLMQLVFESGLSTAREVTQVSGRGVGMDVVTSQIKQLGGGVEVRSEAGKGTEFLVRVPLTLAITESLLVEAGGEVFAVPDATVEGVVRVRREQLEKQFMRGQGEADFSYGGERFVVRSLGSLLYPDRAPGLGDRSWVPLLLTHSGEHRVALQVERLIGHSQVVVKPVGYHLSALRWLSGGTILGDGRVALILDAMALVRADALQGRPVQWQPEPATGTRKPVSVMVVDDSITVRRVTSRLLKRHNMDVVTAKDGVDAMAQLQDRVPDIILLDIEMPRMDGYELARRLRNTKQLRDIPIIMITSRAGEKHRNYASEIGVDRYLGKPYQESELIDNINAVLIESGI